MSDAKILLTGWFSFPDGEVTAGDVLALRRVQDPPARAVLPYDTVWSPGHRPAAPHLEDACCGWRRRRSRSRAPRC